MAKPTCIACKGAGGGISEDKVQQMIDTSIEAIPKGWIPIPKAELSNYINDNTPTEDLIFTCTTNDTALIYYVKNSLIKFINDGVKGFSEANTGSTKVGCYAFVITDTQSSTNSLGISNIINRFSNNNTVYAKWGNISINGNYNNYGYAKISLNALGGNTIHYDETGEIHAGYGCIWRRA